MLNNLSDRINDHLSPALRKSLLRLGIGACTAVLIILAFMLIASFYGRDDERDTALDQEDLALPSTIIAQDTMFSDNDVVTLPSSSVDVAAFANFNAHKKQLNARQQLAIADDKPRYSLVIQMAGENTTNNALIREKLSNNITLSLSPYIADHNAIAQQFKNDGFEIWMLMATETLERRTDNGPFALSPVHNLNSNINALINQLQGKDFITGITFDEKSLMPNAETMWPRIIHDLFAEGYAIHDTTQIPVSHDVYYTAAKIAAPYIKDNVQLDLNASKADITNNLNDIKTRIQARKNMVITTMLTTPAALDILAEWVNSLETEGITLIPLSAQTLNQ